MNITLHTPLTIEAGSVICLGPNDTRTTFWRAAVKGTGAPDVSVGEHYKSAKEARAAVVAKLREYGFDFTAHRTAAA